MPSYLIITPDPELYSAISTLLDIRGHESYQAISLDHWPDENIDLCVIDMPIWDGEEIKYVKQAVNKSTKKNVPAALILPRGHEKPPQGLKLTTVFSRPFELIYFVDQLEAITH